MPEIFNQNRTADDYYSTKLFGNSGIGLLDTINQTQPTIFKFYKDMKSLDWDENEFDFGQCLKDFQNESYKTQAQLMLKNIMWQWETDSVASQVPFALIAPYGPCTEIICAELRINDNENVHGLAYSDIVKMSFEVPKDVLKNMLEEFEAHRRLDVINKALGELKQKSNELAFYGENHFTQHEKNCHMLEFYFLMYLLERGQFMTSFGITFTICESNMFQEIGNAVKKICQDEFEVHADYRLEVIRQLIFQDPGAFDKIRHKLLQYVNEVFKAESHFADYMFNDSTIVGMNADISKKWAIFNMTAIADNFSFKDEELLFEPIRENPLPHLENWININKTQNANQESTNTQYRVNSIIRDDKNVIYEI